VASRTPSIAEHALPALGGTLLSPLRLLPPPFLRTLALRVTILWAFLRGGISVGFSLAAPGVEQVSPEARVGVIGVTALIVWIEMTRRSELLFLANLGYSVPRVAAFVVAQCVGFEVLLRLLGG
jgi:hypothetical protein